MKTNPKSALETLREESVPRLSRQRLECGAFTAAFAVEKILEDYLTV